MPESEGKSNGAFVNLALFFIQLPVECGSTGSWKGFFRKMLLKRTLSVNGKWRKFSKNTVINISET